MRKLSLTLLTCLLFLSPNVVLSETMYDLGRRGGIYYKKFSDIPFSGDITGNPKGEFKNGKREGVWIWENKNGQINTKGNYKNGMEDGSWVTYHENGELYTKGDFKNGNKVGAWVRYWNNAQLMSKGEYKNSKKKGSWVHFNKDGTEMK
jgi:hypothetical protein